MNDNVTPRRGARRLALGTLTGLLLLGSAWGASSAFAGPGSDHPKGPRTTGDTRSEVDVAEHSKGGPSCDARDHGGKHRKGAGSPNKANAGRDFVIVCDHPEGSVVGEDWVSGTDRGDPEGRVVSEETTYEDGTEGTRSETVELTPLSKGGPPCDPHCKSGPYPGPDAPVSDSGTAR